MKSAMSFFSLLCIYFCWPFLGSQIDVPLAHFPHHSPFSNFLLLYKILLFTLAILVLALAFTESVESKTKVQEDKLNGLW